MNQLYSINLPLAGLKVVERHHIGDHRGFLARLFRTEKLNAAGCAQSVTQVNYTHTGKRGMARPCPVGVQPREQVLKSFR